MSEEKNVPEGKLKEIRIQASVGGKIQIVKYQYSADYHYSISQTYEVDDLSPIEAAEFREAKINEIRGHLEDVGQAEIDELQDLRKRIAERENEDE